MTFAIRHTRLTLADIDRALGVAHHAGWDVGEPRPRGDHRPFEATLWRLNSAPWGGNPGGPIPPHEYAELHLAWVLDMMTPVKNRLRLLADQGCEMTLSVRMWTPADNSPGFQVPVTWCRLMAELGGEINVSVVARSRGNDP